MVMEFISTPLHLPIPLFCELLLPSPVASVLALGFCFSALVALPSLMVGSDVYRSCGDLTRGPV